MNKHYANRPTASEDEISTAAASESESEVTFESVLDPLPKERSHKAKSRLLPEGGDSNSGGSRRPQNPHTSRELWGLTLVGAFTGCLIGGPVCGAVGAGATAVAVTSHSKAGDVARKGGEAVARIGDEAAKLDEKHRISKRASRAISNVRDRLKEFDEKNKVTHRVGQSFRNFDEKHQVLEKASMGGCLSCADRFQSRDDTLEIPLTASKLDDHSMLSAGSSARMKVIAV